MHDGIGCMQVSWRTPGVYVPQLGDEVVYLQVGHRKFLSDNGNKLQGPWDSIVSTAVSLVPAAPPTVKLTRSQQVKQCLIQAMPYTLGKSGCLHAAGSLLA